MEVDSFASYYLSREYEKRLSIGRRKRGNNIKIAWQHVILIIYFYRCKIGRPTLIVFSKFPNTGCGTSNALFVFKNIYIIKLSYVTFIEHKFIALP